MSTFFVLSLVLLAFGSIFDVKCGEVNEMAIVLRKICVEETGVDEKLIDACNRGEFSEDRNLMCYLMCLATKVGVMTDLGEINVEAAMLIVSDEDREGAEPVIRKCGTVKGADHCETAFLTNKCWQSNAPEIYKLA